MSRDKFSTVLSAAEIQGRESLVRQWLHRRELGAQVKPKLSIYQLCCGFLKQELSCRYAQIHGKYSRTHMVILLYGTTEARAQSFCLFLGLLFKEGVH